MRRTIFRPIIIAVYFVNLTTALALNPVQEPMRSRIILGIELSMNSQFEESLSIFKEIIDELPDHPAGYFYTGATLQARMMDLEDYGEKDAFYELMNQAITHAEHQIGLRPDDPWLYFYEGSGFLYRSFFKTKEGNWFSAYKDATRGFHLLEKAVALDSTFYDAYLGIGSYLYWKSAKANFLLWLPFISDHREKGIALIHQAVEKGHFSRSVGKDQLVWVLMDNGDLSGALQLAEENARDYPGSRFFQWTLATAAYRSGEWDLSYSRYEKLLDEIRRMPASNRFNEVECLVKMAEIERVRGNWEPAFRLSGEALKLPLDDEIRRRARNKLKKALEIHQQVQKQLSVSDNQ